MDSEMKKYSAFNYENKDDGSSIETDAAFATANTPNTINNNDDFPSSSNSTTLAQLGGPTEADGNDKLTVLNTNKNTPADGQEKAVWLASQWIFRFIVLRAWKTRANKVRSLSIEVGDLKAINLRVKNEINRNNTVYLTEQKRNQELTAKIQSVREDVSRNELISKQLNTELLEVEHSNFVLKEKLDQCVEEEDNLNEELEEANHMLFGIMAEQRELMMNIANESRRVQQLKENNESLLEEYNALEEKLNDLDYQMNAEIAVRDADLEKVYSGIFEHDEYFELVENKLAEVIANVQLKQHEITGLEEILPKKNIALRLANGIRNGCQQMLVFRANNIFDWLAIHLLPTIRLVF